jgi:hypothetical protein
MQTISKGKLIKALTQSPFAFSLISKGDIDDPKLEYDIFCEDEIDEEKALGSCLFRSKL